MSRDDKKTVTIRISGRFDFSLHNEFRKAYNDKSINGGEFVIDLKGTDYLDSSALGMLLLLKEYASPRAFSVLITSEPKL